jgi:hypothetical protein
MKTIEIIAHFDLKNYFVIDSMIRSFDRKIKINENYNQEFLVDILKIFKLKYKSPTDNNDTITNVFKKIELNTINPAWQQIYGVVESWVIIPEK